MIQRVELQEVWYNFRKVHKRFVSEGPLDSENAGRDKDAQISVSPVNGVYGCFFINYQIL